MATIEPGVIVFGPDDVESVEMTFHLNEIGFARFTLSTDGEEHAQFVRDLYTKMLDTYGPGGSNPLPLEVEADVEEVA